MKKLLFCLCFTGVMTACNQGSQTEGSANADSATATATTPPATSDTATAATPAPQVRDSVMQFKDGKVLVYVAGAWTDLSATVTTTNGRTVSPKGEVSKNGKTRKLEEGMMIDKDGQLMDKDGKPLDNTGWE